MRVDEMIDMLTEIVGVNEEVISCMTAVNGYNQKTCEDILYWKTGYEDFQQLVEDLEEN